MKNIVLCVCALFINISALGKIVLLTSLDPDENRPPLRFRSWNINEKLEERFFKSFKKFPQIARQQKVEITHLATPKDLYKNLVDPEVTALIWVGHAGFSDSGISQSRSIIDYKNRDLKNVFQAAHPNLKFLGLVGCRGQLFLEEWKKEGWFKANPKLQTFGRKVRTGARKGLRLAMKELEERLDRDPRFFEPAPLIQSQDTFPVLIERENISEKIMDSIQILQKDRLIGFMDASKEDQYLIAKLTPGKNRFDYKIIADTGFASPAPVNPTLGRLHITSQTDALIGSWELFKTKDGRPIGVGKHIYQFKGEDL